MEPSTVAQVMLSLPFLAILFAIAARSIRQINQWEVGLKFTLGKFAGRMEPGQHLRQEDIAAQWGVSQTPVREAFRRLESEGLVEHSPNKGVVVRGIPWTPPPPPMEAIVRRWDELIHDPESIPGSDFP